MTVGIYTAIGWEWRRVADSEVAHLVPRHPGPLSRTLCGYRGAYDTLLETPRGLLSDLEHCGRCTDKNGTGGPARDGRYPQVGE
jgi:hypothetical protein